MFLYMERTYLKMGRILVKSGERTRTANRRD